MEEKVIKVSVVVATYNQEKYIGHTLESIVSQKVNFKYEVLVGDDCSKDGTAKIVKEYGEKYPDIIVPIIREKNLGMGGNVVDLTMRTKGEYIAFIEGDDYWIDDNKLQKQVDFLDSHPDYVACFGQCMIVDENEVRQPELEKWSGFKKNGGDYTIKEFEDYILPGQTATSMYRKIAYAKLQQKVMESKKIDPRKLIDRSQVLCMLSIGKMYNSGELVSAYRYVMNQNSGSWSSQNDYYSVDNLLKYLAGLKDMEDIAEVLGLELCFDERRKYEWDKYLENRSKFRKEDAKLVKKTLIEDCKDKKAMNLYRFKKFIRGLKK